MSRDYVGYDIRLTATPNGPVERAVLRRAEAFRDAAGGPIPDLVRAIWFGMFAFLSVPLLSALNWVHGFIGNYGWSIIALTVIINAAMFPLRHKSIVSMRKMQEIQPQVKAIQDRYSKLKATDPARQKMNTELMELYRQKGVNPGERLRADAAHLPGAASRSTACCPKRSSCAARRSSGGFTTWRRRIRIT